MADGLLGRFGGTSNLYTVNTYTSVASEKSTLTITDYFKLLTAQPANQDMTNPMDSSEMMVQVTQIAMIQAVSAMTESVRTSTSVSTQVYTAGLMGQEITVTVTEENTHGQPIAVGVQCGKVESVDFTGSTPVLELAGDDNEYPLSCVFGMGKIDDPYKKDEDDGRQTKESDVENEKTDFLPNEYAVREDNLLAGKDIFA